MITKEANYENPFADFPWVQEMRFYPYLEQLAELDQVWLKSIAFAYPQVNLLRHFWPQAFYEFIRHIGDVDNCDTWAEILFRKLMPPKRGTVDWFIGRIEDMHSAREAFLMFISPVTQTGRDLLECFDRWMYEELDMVFEEEGEDLHKIIIPCAKS